MSEKNKHDPAGFFSPGGEKLGDAEARLKRLLGRLRRSLIWPITGVGGKALGAALAGLGASDATIDVEIHAGIDLATWEPIAMPARLTRRIGNGGAIDFELEVEPERLPPPARNQLERYEPFALCLGRLAIWQFEPVVWRQGVVPEVDVTPRSGSRESRQAPSADTTVSASSLAAHSLAAHSLAAHSAERTPTNATSERLELRADENRLEIFLDQPPRRRGQPVVVETRFVGRDRRVRQRREAVSTEQPITEGEFAGRVRGAMETPLPQRCMDFEVTVRPLREGELDLLSAEQVNTLLAGQPFTALTSRGSGLPLRAAATAPDQAQALADEQATWFVQVSQKEVM